MPYAKTTLRFLFSWLLLLSPVFCNAQDLINASFDSLITTGIPPGWQLVSSINAGQYFSFYYDPKDKSAGYYALLIRNDSGDLRLSQNMENNGFDATSITLSARIKLSSGNKDAVRLFVKLSGIDTNIAYGETAAGTNNTWTSLRLSLPFDKERIRNIEVGAIIRGQAACRLDQFELQLDSTAAGKAKHIGDAARYDTTNRWASGVSIGQPSALVQQRLYEAAMIWCFLKYHHPAFTRGVKDADVALFKLLKNVDDTLPQRAWYACLESWISDLGAVGVPDQKAVIKESGYPIHQPHYGNVLQQSYLPDSLYQLLMAVQHSSGQRLRGYYANVPDDIGNVSFSNEKAYEQVIIPDEGLRLLALFRYWGMINYFYPYRESLGDWDKTLAEMIPVFLQASGTQAYTQACQRLISAIHDSHAWVISTALGKQKGMYTVPFQASFIEQQLTITRPCPEYQLSPGDVIQRINNIPVHLLVDSFRTLLSASNNAAYQRDLASPFGYLFRGNDSLMTVHITGKSGTRAIPVKKVNYNTVDISFNEMTPIPPSATASKWLRDSIGYLYPGALSDAGFEEIMTDLQQAKGLIIDLRCYPSLFVPYRITQALKEKYSMFCYTTVPDLNTPGVIYIKKQLGCGPRFNSTPFAYPIVILVNEYTQSQAEFTAMALSTVQHAIVLGSQTAGADGNYSKIVLPGGISTGMSGTGIFYPDGRATQRVGIAIDKVVPVTIKGIAAGKDEQLDAAIDYIHQSPLLH